MDRAAADKFEAFLKSKELTNNKKAATTDFLDDKPTKRVSSVRFSDDLTVKDGQKMTPDVIHRKLLNSVDNTRDQVAAPYETQARAFQNSPTLEYDQKLLDGFYYMLPHNFDSHRAQLGNGTDTLAEDFIPTKLIVDKRNDRRLTEILASAASICAIVPNIEVRAYLLSQIVATSTGGGFLFSEEQIRGILCESADCIKTLNKPTVLIGEITRAWTVARAILFKYLCDRVDVPCKITLREVSPSFMPASNIRHGFAWIRSGDQTSLVDLLGSVGSLYDENKARVYAALDIEQLRLCASTPTGTTHPVKLAKDPTSSLRWFEAIDFNRSAVQTLNLLGKGRYGQVYKAKIGNFVCAMKIVRMESMTKDIKKAIHKEVSLMRLLKHENIVSYLGQEVVSENELHLFLELITKPLDKVVDGIKANERVAFRRSEILLVAKAVASALKYIHNLPTRLMHRDVKARNVLVEVDDAGFIVQAKLCDFGLTTEVFNEKENQLAVGTSRWMAPEAQAMIKYDEKVDVWSFGMLLYEICAMKLPYHEICVLDVKQEIMNGKKVDLESIGVDWPDISALIAECTSFDPKQRSSAEEILSKLDTWTSE